MNEIRFKLNVQVALTGANRASKFTNLI